MPITIRKPTFRFNGNAIMTVDPAGSGMIRLRYSFHFFTGFNASVWSRSWNLIWRLMNRTVDPLHQKLHNRRWRTRKLEDLKGFTGHRSVQGSAHGLFYWFQGLLFVSHTKLSSPDRLLSFVGQPRRYWIWVDISVLQRLPSL